MDDGFYQFAGLESGEYVITLADGSYPNVKVLARTGSVDADLVVAELARSITLAGTIQNDKGQPISGALVMLTEATMARLEATLAVFTN